MLEAILKDEGYGVAAVGTGRTASSAATGRPFDALLLDVWLPGIDGIETLSRLKAAGRRRGGRDDLRSRDDRNGGQGDEARRVRFRREAALARKDAARPSKRAASAPSREAQPYAPRSAGAGHRRSWGQRGRPQGEARGRGGRVVGGAGSDLRRAGVRAGRRSRATSTRRAVARIRRSSTSRAQAWAASRAPRLSSEPKASPDAWRSRSAARSSSRTSTRCPASCRQRSPHGCRCHPDVRVIATAPADPVGLKPPLTRADRRRADRHGAPARAPGGHRVARDAFPARPRARVRPSGEAALARDAGGALPPRLAGKRRELRNVVERALVARHRPTRFSFRTCPSSSAARRPRPRTSTRRFRRWPTGSRRSSGTSCVARCARAKGDVEAAARRAGISVAALRDRID